MPEEKNFSHFFLGGVSITTNLNLFFLKSGNYAEKHVNNLKQFKKMSHLFRSFLQAV